MAASRIRIKGTDLLVSPICLGAAQFGTGIDERTSFDLLDALAGIGGNIVDTGHVYNDFVPGAPRSASEKVIGRWRKATGDTDIIFTTKAAHPAPNDPSIKRLNPRDVRQDIEEALENMGYDSLPFLYLHRDDPNQPVADILGLLEGFRSEGLIRHYGASNWATSRMREAAAIAKKQGFEGFTANQTEWSLARRNPGTAPGTSMDLTAMDDEMIAFHDETGLAAFAYWSQSKGYFDKLQAGTLGGEAERCYDSPLSRRIADVIIPMAERVGATPTEIMLVAQCWTRFPAIPIVGCRSVAQFRSSFRSLDVALTEADVRSLNEVAGFTVPLSDRAPAPFAAKAA